MADGGHDLEGLVRRRPGSRDGRHVEVTAVSVVVVERVRPTHVHAEELLAEECVQTRGELLEVVGFGLQVGHS